MASASYIALERNVAFQHRSFPDRVPFAGGEIVCFFGWRKAELARAPSMSKHRFR
jgi:hypothetical protein